MRRTRDEFIQRWADDRRGLFKVLRDAFNPRPVKPRTWPPAPLPASRADLSPEVARLLLAEAEDLYAARRDQALRAETRATTLQASAGVAIGLALTGAAFLLDPTKIGDRSWRLALAVVLTLMLCCLGMAGYLANRATAKILRYWAPTPQRALERASRTQAEALQQRARELLSATDFNFYFSNFKITHVKVAGLWFRAGLACFAALSVLLMLYTALGPIPDLGG